MRFAEMRTAEVRRASLGQRRRSGCWISVSDQRIGSAYRISVSDQRIGSACRGLASLTPPQLVDQGHLTRHMLARQFT